MIHSGAEVIIPINLIIQFGHKMKGYIIHTQNMTVFIVQLKIF